MIDISEKNFEASIEATLLAGGPDASPDDGRPVPEARAPYGDFTPGGYHKRVHTDYDRALCLIPQDVLDFIYVTQPKEWARFKKLHGPDAKERLLKRLASEVKRRGTLTVLRKGIKSDGCRFRLAYFRPVSGLNEDLQRLYEANLFSIVRQLHYSQRNENSLDLGIFLNGLPIFTAELKNPLTGQNVENAIRQYRFDRDPQEPFFAFGRCLAHFAVDPDLVYVTTHLQGSQTRFLPFNMGRNGGAGNPPSWQNFATAYLWRRIWARDSILNLIQHFIHIVEEEDDKGRKTGKRRLVFPRYHQLDSVRRLVRDAREKGTGHRYLIQHSAGSGKSFSIAWLAHQLSVLHDDQDRRIFDSIVVITDRRVLDRQLQRTVRQFEQVAGVVENIDKTSRQLKQALEQGKTIIVTTLQKFPVIAEEISQLAGQRFAVVIDEAHSSQTGESTKSLKSVLAVGSLEEAEAEDVETGDDIEDRIIAEIKKRGQLPNVSHFAYTATPKPKTMELFGTQGPDGRFTPFSLYSMRQAIEEDFILDVLENYTTYKTYWNLLKKIEDDPHYERSKAAYLLRSFVDMHEHAIGKKVEIMVEHFASQVMGRIGGKARAMVVTRSRLHAVRYKLAVDRYLKEKGYPFKALVAFSGTVTDSGIKYTEASINGFSEKQTAQAFNRDEYRLLIVAYKFQTGFNQPLLHTMYVDQRLAGVQAVQTLSRLNRVHPGKEETMVLDFVNETDDIQEAFEPYYDRTILTEGTDPNLLYDLETHLEDFDFYTSQDVDCFAQIYFNPEATQDKLHAALQPVVDRYKAAHERKEDQAEFRGTLTDYVRLYAFLSQILPFTDPDLEKLYVFGRLLLRKLPASRERLPVEIQQQIDIESYRVQQTGSGRIILERGQGELEPIRAKGTHIPTPDELEPLSVIITELNDRFGTDFSEGDQVVIEQLEAKLAEDLGLSASVRVNTPDNARLTFDHVATDKLQDMIDTNFKFYKQVTDNPEFAELLFDWMFERYLKRMTNEVGEIEGSEE
jgi:type I restriction enzyme R subunit